MSSPLAGARSLHSPAKSETACSLFSFPSRITSLARASSSFAVSLLTSQFELSSSLFLLQGSKRRTGIMKKAKELTVLCDAEVSIIMFSSTGKFSEYCSPSTETKKMYDRYQQVTGINLWSAQYEKMQNYLNHLKEINRNLRKEIRQRMGEGLAGMDVKELRGLEQNLDEALKIVRDRKYHLITTQTDTYKKKLKSAHEAHRNLLQDLEMKDEQAAAAAAYSFGPGDDEAGSNDGAVMLSNGGPHMYAIRVQPNQPNLQGFACGFYDLRLA